MSIFDSWPWGYCDNCKKLVCIDDEELMVRHDNGYTANSYQSNTPVKCEGSNHKPTTIPGRAEQDG